VNFQNPHFRKKHRVIIIHSVSYLLFRLFLGLGKSSIIPPKCLSRSYVSKKSQLTTALLGSYPICLDILSASSAKNQDGSDHRESDLFKGTSVYLELLDFKYRVIRKLLHHFQNIAIAFTFLKHNLQKIYLMPERNLVTW